LRVRSKLKAKAVKTGYWKPGTNFLEKIVEALEGEIRNGDVVTISEKAISTAIGNIIDEDEVKPGKTAYLLARYWMRLVWGYFLGILARLKPRNLERIRNYPVKEGAAHKQVALSYAGFLPALHVWSEGGIDGSNLPYSYVSLPLCNPQEIADKIRRYIKQKLGKNVYVVIVDTDKTYSFFNLHFAPRPTCVEGIFSFGGIFAYVFGRFLRLKRRATPVAVAGCNLNADEALRIAEISNRVRGVGAGRTVWDMAQIFDVGLTEVSWSMLERVKHKPLVIVRMEKGEA